MLRSRSFVTLCLFWPLCASALPSKGSSGDRGHFIHPFQAQSPSRETVNSSSSAASTLLSRDSATIDLSTIPSCGDLIGAIFDFFTGGCAAPDEDDLPGCPRIEIPCPSDPDNTCYTYSTDCYCAQPTPLACAWSCSDWPTWLKTEDWFAGVCPVARPLDFSPLPGCIRDCLETSSIKYGCIAGGTNCFCLAGSLFGCPEQCSSERDLNATAVWYQETCGFNQANSSLALGGEQLQFYGNLTRDPTGLNAGKGKHGLRWYEIVVVVMAPFSFVLLVVTGWWFGLRVREAVEEAEEEGEDKPLIKKGGATE